MASWTPRRNKDGEIVSYQIKVSRGRGVAPYTMTYTPKKGWSEKAIEEDLLKTAILFEADCKNGKILTKREEMKLREEAERAYTFKQYTEVFLRERTSLSANSIAAYQGVFRRAIPYFGKMKMTDITKANVSAYLAELSTNAKNQRTGKPLAFSTLDQQYLHLRAFFQTAADNEVIPANPMQTLKRPKPKKDMETKEPIVYNEDQLKYIMESLAKESLKWQALVMLLIDSGCRRGEAIGLMWPDIDFKSGRCTISRNAQNTAHKGTYINKTKSGKSRVILLNRPVLDILKEWRKEQLYHDGSIGVETSGFVFTQENGRMLNPQSLSNFLVNFGKKYNLPGIHPHALRHSMATIAIANGADIVSVSKKLGHSTPSITLNVYAHATEEAQRRTNDIIATALYENEALRRMG